MFSVPVGNLLAGRVGDGTVRPVAPPALSQLWEAPVVSAPIPSMWKLRPSEVGLGTQASSRETAETSMPGWLP